jgi:hypothetical protein
MAQFKTYAWVLLIGILAPVLLVGGFNLFALRQPRNPDRFAEASAWQEKTHGITMVLLQRSDNGPFKALRLNDRLRDINAVVFGASTSMAIRDDMFPAGVRIYNFSQPGNPLSSTIGQAQYVLDHDDGIKWMFVPLDWAVGFLYFPADRFVARSRSSGRQCLRQAAALGLGDPRGVLVSGHQEPVRDLTPSFHIERQELSLDVPLARQRRLSLRRKPRQRL